MVFVVHLHWCTKSFWDRGQRTRNILSKESEIRHIVMFSVRALLAEYVIFTS